MRIATVDIETWDLSAPFGPILCVSFYDHQTQEMFTLRNDTYLRSRKYPSTTNMVDDEDLLKDIKDIISSYHMLWGWNSKAFDIPHLRSRMVLNGIDPFGTHFHVDGMWAFRGWHGLKLGSSKLGRVAKALRGAGYPISTEKPEVEADVWLRARNGDRDSMDIVQSRCEDDTLITHEIISVAFDLGLIKNLQRFA